MLSTWAHFRTHLKKNLLITFFKIRNGLRNLCHLWSIILQSNPNSTFWKHFSEPFPITIINTVPKLAQKNKDAFLKSLEQCVLLVLDLTKAGLLQIKTELLFKNGLKMWDYFWTQYNMSHTQSQSSGVQAKSLARQQYQLAKLNNHTAAEVAPYTVGRSARKKL